MPSKKRGLGRGLSALMSDPDATLASGEAGPIQTVPISELKANPSQPRTHFDPAQLDDLVASVKEKGVLTPLLVRPAGDGYEIIAGERRWRASQRAGIHDLPVVVREVSDQEALELALVENVQRADLTPIEEAKGYRRLMDEFGYTQEALSKQLGKSRSHIANILRLMSLPTKVQKAVDEGRLSTGHAKALIGTPDAERLALLVENRGLNVRQTEALVRGDIGGPAPSRKLKPAKVKDADTQALEQEISEALGLTVAVDHKGPGGSVTIRYTELDQLDLISERLMARN